MISPLLFACCSKCLYPVTANNCELAFIKGAEGLYSICRFHFVGVKKWCIYALLHKEVFFALSSKVIKRKAYPMI